MTISAYIPKDVNASKDTVCHSRLDKPVKPMHRLLESPLLCPPLPLVFQVAADRKAMYDVREEIDLPRDIHAEQDVFGFMSLLRRKNLIDFY